MKVSTETIDKRKLEIGYKANSLINEIRKRHKERSQGDTWLRGRRPGYNLSIKRRRELINERR